MYRVALKKDFIAQHFLGLEDGLESCVHSHPYSIEVQFEGRQLDQKGYLLDIAEVGYALYSTNHYL